ncbi:MAG TPA: ATP-binding protein [Cytophagales bacterium]|nr:ATP-binding protein [Cytophagales bacterium]
MDADKIELEISRGENDTQDFKQEITSVLKIAKTIVAFANTKGGRLWIGVKDNGKIIGCEPLEEQYMIEHAAAEFCKPAINVEFVKHCYEDKEILEVRIPFSKSRPHFAKDEAGKWWAYVRYKDHTVLAGIVTLESYKKKNKDILIKYTETERSILVFIAEQGRVQLNQVTKDLKIKRHIAVMILSNLVATGILEVNHENHTEYFNSALN